MHTYIQSHVSTAVTISWFVECVRVVDEEEERPMQNKEDLLTTAEIIE